eukprot:7623129-Alexandrium_andersonii.AAC.1
MVHRCVPLLNLPRAPSIEQRGAAGNPALHGAPTGSPQNSPIRGSSGRPRGPPPCWQGAANRHPGEELIPRASLGLRHRRSPGAPRQPGAGP